MRVAAALALTLLATPALAKDVTLTLNDQEQKAFVALLDAALKAGGLQNLGAVSSFVAKFQKAVKEQSESVPKSPEPEAPKP